MGLRRRRWRCRGGKVKRGSLSMSSTRFLPVTPLMSGPSKSRYFFFLFCRMLCRFEMLVCCFWCLVKILHIRFFCVMDWLYFICKRVLIHNFIIISWCSGRWIWSYEVCYNKRRLWTCCNLLVSFGKHGYFFFALLCFEVKLLSLYSYCQFSQKKMFILFANFWLMILCFLEK